MKNLSLKSLTIAHNKVGIFISSLVLIIFVTGSFSIFRAELNNKQWQLSNNTQMSAGQIIAVMHQADLIGQGAQVKVKYPTTRAFYYRIVVKHQGDERHYVYSAEDGRLLATSEQDSFADVVFSLHTHLLLPAGKFVIGFTGLYLLFVLQSGLVIHWRQIKSHLFKFRPDKTRDKWLDLHKLFGLFGLPFSFMVVLTGVIFNLILLYQAAFVVLLYKGDAKPLLADAGFYQHNISASEQAMAFTPQQLDAITKDEKLKSLNLEHFGLDSAVVQLDFASEAFVASFYRIYQLGDGQLLYSNEGLAANASSFGVEVMKQLHIADYGGNAIQWLYFALGLSCCLLVFAGNVLWLNRQKAKPTLGPFSLRMIRAVLYACSYGVSIALVLGVVAVFSGLSGVIAWQTWPLMLLFITLVTAASFGVVGSKVKTS